MDEARTRHGADVRAIDAIAWRLLAVAWRLLAVAMVLAACHGGTGPCSPEDRATIGANYEAEVALACPDHAMPLRDCAAYAAIEARYQAARKEFVECQR